MIESVVRRTYALRESIDVALQDNVDDVISVALRECDKEDYFVEIMNRIARKIRRNERSERSFARLYHQGVAMRILVHAIHEVHKNNSERDWRMLKEAIDELEHQVYRAR